MKLYIADYEFVADFGFIKKVCAYAWVLSLSLSLSGLSVLLLEKFLCCPVEELLSIPYGSVSQ
jgi:hypothetical protein